MKEWEQGATRSREDAVAPRPGYQELVAWKKAMELVSAVYHATRNWPRDEQFGLTSPTRRAAVSIPSNLAEGHGRSGSREFAHHASIAYGSLCEVETQLLIAQQLGYTDAAATERLMGLTSEVRWLTLGILRSLNGRTAPSPHS